MNLLVAYIFGILTALVTSGKPHDPPHDGNPESTNHDDSTHNIAPAKTQIPPSDAGSNQPKKEKKWWPKTFKQWVEVLGVCVLAVYTIYTIKLYHRASEANMQARRGGQLDQRAWVAVSEIVPGDETKTPWTINLVFKNTGKTPAKKFSVKLAGEPVAKGGKPVAAEEVYAENGIIAPDGFFRSGLSSHTKYNWETTDLVVHGRIYYNSVFGKEHWTQFCYYFVPKSASRTNGFTPCNQGNDVDDGEP
jgi:hypothetical protein